MAVVVDSIVIFDPRAQPDRFPSSGRGRAAVTGDRSAIFAMGVVILPDAWIIGPQMGSCGVSGLIWSMRVATIGFRKIRKLHGYSVVHPVGAK